MKITDERIIEAIKNGKELYRRSFGIHRKYHIRIKERGTVLEAFVRCGIADFIQAINLEWLEADDWEIV